MANVTSSRSEQRLDDGHEALPVLGGVPQQSGADQNAVSAKLPELLSMDWDFGCRWNGRTWIRPQVDEFCAQPTWESHSR